VHEAHLGAIGADRPRTIELVPGAFMTVQKEVGIDRVELQVIQVAVLKAGFARGARFQVGEDE